MLYEFSSSDTVSHSIFQKGANYDVTHTFDLFPDLIIYS
jgi:hypothetical protein